MTSPLSEDGLVQRKKRKVYGNNINLVRENAKQRRVSGEGYVTSSGKEVNGKKFTYVEQCCKENCWNKFSRNCQEEQFLNFYNSRDKCYQDSFLSKAMGTVLQKTVSVHAKKTRAHTWVYNLSINGMQSKVCQGFIRYLFQVSVKKIRIIQDKILNNEDLTERRGVHENRPHKLKSNVLDLMKSHLESIPHSESHYCANKTSLLYFDNPDLNIKSLYTMFQEFYKSQTKEALKMGYPHYFKLFKSNFNFGMRSPKTDVCDFCSECKQKLALDSNDDCKVPYQIHQRKYKKRQELRKDFIEKAKTDPVYLVCEFDYAQNYAVPKLNVNSQFYKRLLWLYAFNIHVFNNDESYFYCFMETQSDKNSNSVVSFLYECLKQNLQIFKEVKTVVLLSDSAGGQNRNSTMVKFCSWFSKVFGVEVLQLFPVRGHSFSQCDRNFGLVRSKIKKTEVIGTAKPWLQAIVEARQNPSPFQVIMDRDLIKQWDVCLSSYFVDISRSAKKLKFTIMKYVMIKYKPCGSVLCSNSFFPNYKPFKFLLKNDKSQLMQAQPETVPFPKVSEAKIADVRSLMKHLPLDDKDWLEALIDEAN